MHSGNDVCHVLSGERVPTAGVHLLISWPTERFVRDSTCERYVLTKNVSLHDVISDILQRPCTTATIIIRTAKADAG